eukprot:TRINITY_DN5031_c0_g1_i2.p1 TRINITY_DN5031_c0_g1~~TRINITY_DN5031_c0_g1_i2.p1  ORF type:complete len:583 (-),score=69.21 TRINITY_DN5031_c0_g1_i2:37-1785(-)
MSSSTGSTTKRAHYLDTIRILIIPMLIYYHTNRIFEGHHNRNHVLIYPRVHTEFTVFVQHEMSRQQATIIQAGLNLFCLVSGMAFWYSIENKGSMLLFILERIKKLIIGFIFGFIFVAIPTNYLISHCKSYEGFFWDIPLFFFSQRAWNPGHLNFLPYLFFLTVAFLPPIRFAGKIFSRLRREEARKDHGEADLEINSSNGPSSSEPSHVPKSLKGNATILALGAYSVLTVILFIMELPLVSLQIIASAIVLVLAYVMTTPSRLEFSFFDGPAIPDPPVNYRTPGLGFIDRLRITVETQNSSELWFNLAFPGLMLVTNFLLNSLLISGPLLLLFTSMLLLPFVPKQVYWERNGLKLSFNGGLCILYSLGLAQLAMMAIPETMPTGLGTDSVNFWAFSIPEVLLSKVFLMGFNHGSFFLVGYVWIVVEKDLPAVPQNNALTLFLCAITFLTIPYMILDKHDDLTTLTPGYYTFKMRFHRIGYSIGAWIWIYSFLMMAKEKGNQAYENGPKILTFILNHSFGVILCHVFWQALFGCFFYQVSEETVPWALKIILTHILVFTMSYAWSYTLSQIPLIRSLFGTKM